MDEPNTNDGGASLSVDATLELLGDHERRALLQFLRETTGSTASVQDLIPQLRQHIAERTGERVSRDQIKIRLYHTHLPRLANTGIIEYDARSEELKYYSNDRLEAWLDRIQAEESS